MIDFDPRDPDSGSITQEIELRRARETQIMQKVNAAHRQAFVQKFPGQIEHCLRLTVERLQQGLRKDQVMPISNHEVYHLAQAINLLYRINHELDLDTGR
jgi:hypothetical protein